MRAAVANKRVMRLGEAPPALIATSNSYEWTMREL
jgi:hypothetical protein